MRQSKEQRNQVLISPSSSHRPSELAGARRRAQQSTGVEGKFRLAAERTRVLVTEPQPKADGDWWPAYCLGGATLCSMALVGEFAAVLPWMVTLGLLVWVGKRWDRATRQRGRLLRILVTAFVALSFIGMLEVSDNLRNFGTIFGKALDDSSFFSETLSFLRDRAISDRFTIYHVVLAVWGFLPNLIFDESTIGLHFMFLNWALGAIVVGLCDNFCYVIIKRSVPLWLLMVTLIGNYKFADALIHIYRDGLMLLFLLLALTAALRASYVRSLVSAAPVSLLRGANFLLYSFVLAILIIFRRAGRRAVLYGGSMCIFGAAAWLVPTYGLQAFKYATSLTHAGYSEYTAGATVEDHISFRANMVAAQVAQDSTLKSTLANDSIVSMSIRPIVFVLFPIRYWPLFMSGDSASTFATSRHIDRGLTLFNIYVWFSISCGVVVLPLMVIGLGKALCGPRKQNVISIYYLMGIFSVSFISFQMRHSVSFIIIHPLLAMLGCVTLRNSYRLTAMALCALTVSCIVIYNILSGSLL